MRKRYSETAITEILQKISGLKGFQGISGDMHEIHATAPSRHHGAIGALEVFLHQLLQLIGAMAIGEHDKKITVIAADEQGMIARLCQRRGDVRLSATIG